jgi:hypothetical protein
VFEVDFPRTTLRDWSNMMHPFLYSLQKLSGPTLFELYCGDLTQAASGIELELYWRLVGED